MYGSADKQTRFRHADGDCPADKMRRIHTVCAAVLGHGQRGRTLSSTGSDGGGRLSRRRSGARHLASFQLRRGQPTQMPITGPGGGPRDERSREADRRAHNSAAPCGPADRCDRSARPTPRRNALTLSSAAEEIGPSQNSLPPYLPFA
ncbi:hypothetical protein SKAU_G00177830 [Synaphobranchus kaupii]|uniref:Uncharacterized protein n=1 Tax=Synaphobranchus kaupii TaxID=118154 RepID=A0A9Q1FM14_SYNKA|nr:hypothetical protein SKAU_G00177830 [Synaphobranchus kaupii]